MRLGLDLLFLIPGETGGRETFARELIPALLAADPTLDPVAFTSRDGGTGWARRLGLRAVEVPVSIRRVDRWATAELVQLPVAGARAEVDLMHSLANFGPAAGPFARVLTLHDLQWRAVPELSSAARRLGTEALVRAAAVRAHRLTTGSQAARDEIVETFDVRPERIDANIDGVVHAVTAVATEADVRTMLGLPERRPLLLSVATALPHKNLARLLEALALIEPARRPGLALTGARTDSAELAARVRALSLTGDVRLLGFVTLPTLERLYALATGVVIPTLYEGFGLPVAEALARTTPVACSDLAVLRELAGDTAIYFDPRRPQAIAEAMLALVEDHARMARLAVAGRQRVAALSWEATARGTLDSYRRALVTAGRAAPAAHR
jgi:glycosyltransferase involved in cell wall biosynthesis